MSFSEYFPVYDKLPEADRDLLSRTTVLSKAKKGTLLHNGSNDCMGLLLIRSGQLRAYITSDEGKEITLYRLLAHDLCIFAASCVMNSIQFELMITVEKDAEFWVVPPMVYKTLVERNADIANYTNQIMSTRFTDVMWLLEQVMWKSFDKRLAAFLLEEADLENANVLKITHEQIAAHLGTAREVVTRMLKYFQSEGMVTLTRGAITISDEDRLSDLAQ